MVRARIIEESRTIEFFDHIGNEVTRIGVSDPTTLASDDSEDFQVSVANAYRLYTDHVTLNRVPTVVLRDDGGNPIHIAKRFGADLDQIGTTIEICSPVKLYLQPSDDVSIESGPGTLRLTFPTQQWIQIGVRAQSQVPTGSVTTTAAVEDVFRAIGTFGAAIGTDAPSRSFPSERRHPPELEFGRELDVPDRFRHHDPRIAIEVPESYMSAAIAAPLAYYLGASLAPSPSPAIRIDGESVYEIESPHTMVDECHELLRRCLLLDGVIAADRRYDVQLDAKERIAASTRIDWAEISELPGPDRLRAYLSISRDEMYSLLPDVHQPAYVVSSRAAIESLPYLVNDLAHIRGRFDHGKTTAVTDGGILRHPGPNRVRPTPPHHTSSPPDVTAIGERIPIGRHPAYPRALRNRTHRDSASDSITITVVCNEMRMRPELDKAEIRYQSRDTVPIEVTILEELTREDLTDELARRTDYFHYIGHIEDQGFLCDDGHLDVHNIDDIGVELFFLNSCESIHQAIGLIEAGACGGIATHQRVKNRIATRVGSSISESLTRGFPLGVSLQVGMHTEGIRDTYTIVGDPKLDITGTESRIPYTCHLGEGDGGYRLSVETHLTNSVGAGSICTFRFNDDVPYFLHPTSRSFDLDLEDVIRFLELEEVPVWIDDTLMWSQEAIERLSVT